MPVLRIDALKDARRIPMHDDKKFDPGCRHHAVRSRDRSASRRGRFATRRSNGAFTPASRATAGARRTGRDLRALRRQVDATGTELPRIRRPEARQRSRGGSSMNIACTVDARSLVGCARAGRWRLPALAQKAFARRRQAAADHDPHRRRRRGIPAFEKVVAALRAADRQQHQARRRPVRRHAREGAQRGAQRPEPVRPA